MNAHKQVLYNVAWQKLRVSLLGGWTSVKGTRENIDKLSNYVDAATSDAERLSRLWRVLNCLNAVRMGNSGQGKAGSVHDLLVLEFRVLVSRLYDNAKGDDIAFVVDSNEKVRQDWLQLDKASQKAILDNLSTRQRLHASSQHRTELANFLSIIRE